MSKKLKILLVFLCIIIAVNITIFIANKSNTLLNGSQKKIYNLFKEDDISINIKSLKDTPSFSIMSYNIHRGKDYQNKYSMEEIMNYLRESDIDIICLQEVLLSNHQLLRELGNYHSQFVANIQIPIVSTGLATYSKYPVIESNHIILTSKTEPRGALHTVYNINNKLINVINVHLGLDRKERIKQVKELIQYSKILDGDVIIVGDFNQDPLSLECFRDVGKYHGYSNKKTFIPRKVRIDYIFMTTNNIYSTNYDNVNIKLSDHYPITTDIKYKPSKYIK